MIKAGDLTVFLAVVAVIGVYVLVIHRFMSGRWSMKPGEKEKTSPLLSGVDLPESPAAETGEAKRGELRNGRPKPMPDPGETRAVVQHTFPSSRIEGL